MPIDFPASPTVGDSYSYGTNTWIWTGAVWVSSNSGQMPAGKVLQFVSSFSTTEVTTTVQLPDDDTIPQNTEGAEIIPLTITPVSALSKIRIEAQIPAYSTANRRVVLALFVDATLGAIAAMVERITASGHMPMQVLFIVDSGSTAERTYKIRGGSAEGANTVGFFDVDVGTVGNRPTFGGIGKIVMTATEFLP